MKKRVLEMVKKMVRFSAIESANSTTSFTAFQPKAPAELKKFSKIENDK